MKKDYPKLFDLLILFFIFTASQLASIIIIQIFFSILNLRDNNLYIITSLIVPPLSFSIVLYWASKKANFKLLLKKQKISLSKISSLILAGLGLSIILSEVNNISQSFVPLSATVVESINQIAFNNHNIRLIFIISLAIITPILKEIFFRGIVLEGLLKKNSTTKAVFLTVILAIAFNFNPRFLITTITIQLLLTWLYLNTRSVFDCIIANLSYNLIPYLLIIVFDYQVKGYNTEMTEVAHFQPLWFNLLGILLLGMGSFVLLRTLKERKN